MGTASVPKKRQKLSPFPYFGSSFSREIKDWIYIDVNPEPHNIFNKLLKLEWYTMKKGCTTALLHKEKGLKVLALTILFKLHDTMAWEGMKFSDLLGWWLGKQEP